MDAGEPLMAQKAGVPFKHASELKLFTLGQNRRVEAWIAQNWDRAGLTGPLDKSYISKALSGLPILEPVVKALDMLFAEICADPWAWCEPPEHVEDMPEYAPLSWWYVTLSPPIPWTTFSTMSVRPLKEAYREVTQTRLSEWRSRLKGACDQYKADRALVEALRADVTPEYQHWVQEESGWRLAQSGGQKYRVGNPGLRGRPADEIGLAYALADTSLPLPLITEARLAYQMPEAWPVDDHVSEPVEPWNGQEFEGVEWVEWKGLGGADLNLGLCEVENRVVYCWDGERYVIADLPDGVGRAVRLRQRTGNGYYWLPWRAATFRERDLIKYGFTRAHDTEEELLSMRDEKIAEIWEGQQESWAENSPYSPFNQKHYPDGIPEAVAIAQFEVNLERARTNPKVRDEQAEIARRKMGFRQRLRRRP